MDATSFQAPLNIKKLFIKNKEELEKEQYLVIPNNKIDGVYNIYLTIKSPTFEDGILNLDANNLLLINYYRPEKSTFSIENLTKSLLIQSLDKIFGQKTFKIKSVESTAKSIEEKSNTLSPDLTKSVMVDEPKSKLPTIELGSSIGSTPSSISSIANDKDWPDKCDIYLKKRDSNWIKDSYDGDYEIYDVPPDGNCYFYSFIEALKYKLPLEDKTNIKYIPDKILEILKFILEVNEIMPDDPVLKIQEVSNTLPSNMCSKYNLSVLALRYILSLEADEEYFNTYIFRFDDEDEKKAAGIENITTLEEFKKYILTDKYWADEWAISKFQKIFNIQFVIFNESENNFPGCNLTGEIYSSATSKEEISTILLNWIGNSHYQLVTYNDNALIDFDDLPSMVKDSCLSKTTGGKVNKNKKERKTKRKNTKLRRKITKKYNKKHVKKERKIQTKRRIKKYIKKSKTNKKNKF